MDVDDDDGKVGTKVGVVILIANASSAFVVSARDLVIKTRDLMMPDDGFACGWEEEYCCCWF